MKQDDYDWSIGLLAVSALTIGVFCQAEIEVFNSEIRPVAVYKEEFGIDPSPGQESR